VIEKTGPGGRNPPGFVSWVRCRGWERTRRSRASARDAL